MADDYQDGNGQAGRENREDRTTGRRQAKNVHVIAGP